MLQRWPLPFLSSASRMKRDVTPWATPVSTTFPGWRWRVKHQIDRTSAASPSFQPLKLRGPARTPFRSSPSITSGHKAQNSELTLHGYGQPSRRCRRCSQSASALYRSGGVGPSRCSALRSWNAAQASSGSDAAVVNAKTGRRRTRCTDLPSINRPFEARFSGFAFPTIANIPSHRQRYSIRRAARRPHRQSEECGVQP